jgi:hypothetical protein
MRYNINEQRAVQSSGLREIRRIKKWTWTGEAVAASSL